MLMPVALIKKKPGYKPGFEVEKFLIDSYKLVF
jgi:hypothetical protein